jgi:hypothetical protein
MFGCRGTIQNDTGSFLISAHEKANEINIFVAPSGPPNLSTGRG